jgi:hypothetical protein
MQAEKKPFETWAIVELMGHNQIAGRVTEEPIAGTALLRVDVPQVGEWPGHTKYFGGGSIYAIHPCTEDIARSAAERLQSQYGYTPLPVAVPELTEARAVLADAARTRIALAAGQPARGAFDDDDDRPF